MIVRLGTSITDDQARGAQAEARRILGCDVGMLQTGAGFVLLLPPGGASPSADLITSLRALPGVIAVSSENQPFTLSAREEGLPDTEVEVAGVRIGACAPPAFIAGPCAVESHDQLRRAAEAVCQSGARLLRGGAYKPRTSPWSFQGLGEQGLHLLREVAGEFGLGVVTEVMSPSDVALVAEHADMLQVGTRNAQNFPLLTEVGRAGKPVLLKRGLMQRVDELLAAADYILAEGNPNVVLCERGIRSFDPTTRNVLDLMAVPTLRRLSHLPILVDPSHGTGRADLVPDACRGAMAVGADGLLVEVHPDPSVARCDGAQALTPAAWAELSRELRAIATARQSAGG